MRELIVGDVADIIGIAIRHHLWRCFQPGSQFQEFLTELLGRDIRKSLDVIVIIFVVRFRFFLRLLLPGL